MYFAADSDIALWKSGLDAEGCFKDQSQARRGPVLPNFGSSTLPIQSLT